MEQFNKRAASAVFGENRQCTDLADIVAGRMANDLHNWQRFGDLEPYTRMFESVRPSLERTAYRILGNADSAADLCSDVWLKCRCLSDKTGPSGILACLHIAIRRLALTELKKANRLVRLDESRPFLAEHDAPACEMVWMLPPDESRVLALYYFDGLTDAEVGRRLGIGPYGARALRLCALRRLAA